MTCLDGAACFKLVDTFGLPFPVLRDELKKRQLLFDVREFVKAALKAGWKGKKVLATLTEDIPNTAYCKELKMPVKGILQWSVRRLEEK